MTTTPIRYGYLRTGNGLPDAGTQRKLLEADQPAPGVWVTDESNSALPWRHRPLCSLMRQQARAGDVIAAADPRCLGHSLQEVLAVLLEALQRGIRISLPGIGAIGPADEEPETVLRLAAAIDRSLSASRTGAAVAARKAAGKRVGRPSGTRNQLMVLDGRRDELARLLSLGLSKSKAADALGVHRNSLRAYLLQKPLG